MERTLFGHRAKKRATGRTPGEPYNSAMYSSYGEEEDNPPGYEGKEHVKYKNAGFSSHEADLPRDEPHMKGHVGKEESHEMEDDYHMGVPDQTAHKLEAHIKRARMKMDAPNWSEREPDKLRGNLVHDTGYQGEEDTSGEEEEGPNEMQTGKGMGKEHRKKMIVQVMKRKMHKNKY